MKKFRKAFLVGWTGFCLLTAGITTAMASSGDKSNLPELRIGCEEYDPYNYVDENGGLVGIDADIAAEACERMGYKPVYIVMEWSQRDRFLQYGIIDCVWNCFSMEGREDDYLWSDPYLYSKESVLVKKDSDIYTIKELDGKAISVQADSISEEILLNADEMPKIVAGNVCSFQELNEAVSAMRLGYVDAVAGDRESLVSATEDSEDYRILSQELAESEIAVGFKKDGDQELVKKLNKVLKEMRDDGTIRDILKEYGITEDEIPKEAADIEQ